MPTTDELLDLAPGIGQRASEVRFDLLDRTLTKIGELQPDLESTPAVENNMNRTIKRTLSRTTLNARVRGAVDVFADRLRPVWVLENGAEFPLGVFIFASSDNQRWEWGLDSDVSGVDQLFILDQPLPHGVALEGGSDVRAAIVQMFSEAAIPSFEIDAMDVQVANPIAWPAGTSRLKVVNELAAMAGCSSAYFDNAGVGRVRFVVDLALAVPTLIYDRGGRILEGSIVETDSLLDAPNQYVVIDSSSPTEAIVGTYNVPDGAPYSAANRGFVVATTIQEQGLTSAGQANQRAAAAYAEAGSGFSFAQFSSPPDPRHDTFDAVSYLGDVYREQRWSLPLLEGSAMVHECRRAYGVG